MKSRRTRNPGAGGKVDYDRLSKAEREVPMFLHLQSKANPTNRIQIYGYSVFDDNGPWFGYDPQVLNQAPCNHCGQVGNGLKLHVCPGHYANRTSEGELVKCNWDGIKSDSGEHVCHGKPSMSWHGIKRYSTSDWQAYVWKGDEKL